MKDQLNHELQTAQQQISQQGKRLSRIALIRFLLFLVMAWSVFQLAEDRQGWWLMLLVSGALFLLCLHHHQQLRRQQQRWMARSQILQRCLTRFDGSWKTLPDTGADLIDPQQNHVLDLDVFGPNSLYQYLCMAKLPQGRKRLAELLSCPHDEAQIIRRQKTVRALRENLTFLLDDWTESHLLSDQQAQALSREKVETLLQPVTLPVPRWLIRSLPIVTLTMLALTVSRIVPLLWFMLLFFAQAALALFSMGPVRCSLQTASQCRYGLQSSLNRCRRIVHQAPACPHLDTLVSQLSQKEGFLHGAAMLDRLLDLLSLNANPFLYLPCQLLLLWDLQCLIRWNHWIRRGGRQWLNVLDQLGELEALESLTMCGLTHQEYCFPQFHHQPQPDLQLTRIAHPLLDPQTAIANDLTLNCSLTVITGSNMSGKTTFMRTVGLNQILAQAGGYVCAAAMSTCCFRLLSSMRIRDDLSEGISTFYGELMRIRQILNAVADKQPLLILIDELFRGTNSLDRIDGSKEVLKRLDHPWIRALITTHDLQLCQSAKANVHFEEQYQDGKILFDYRLKSGPCTTRNARYLMKMVGISD